MNSSEVERYLERIGARRPSVIDADALAVLQERHLRTVPFENLDIHLSVPIVLDEAALFEKIVMRRRGGFCYELNGLFAALLSHLGFAVTVLSARVFDGDGLGPPFDHMALRVDLDEPWLADVGFGRFCHHPLRLDSRDSQVDSAGTFRIVDEAHGDVTPHLDGRPQYRLEAARPRELADFEATCWWQQTSPKSHFRTGPLCSILTERGRVTLAGEVLVETVDGVRTESRVEGEAALFALYRERFGVELSRLPDGV